MSTPVRLSYGIVTPARNEADSLPRLAQSIRLQDRLPERWVIVENGSSDDTLAIARDLRKESPWIDVLSVGEVGAPVRGAPIVEAIEAGLNHLPDTVDVVVNVDADVSMESIYFDRLVAAFEEDRSLGIASGSAWEEDEEGVWRQRFVTGGTVWGATRAYRRACLDDVMPLERRHGWDGIDQLKARALGWRTETLLDLPFKHHRPEGVRDGSTWAHWRACGESSYYMGYRPWYLVTRALHQARRDPAAVAMVWGFLASAARRRPTWSNEHGKAVLRDDQRFRHLARRRRRLSAGH